MVKRNPKIENLQANYLFSQIAQAKNNILKKQPEADIISLGIGDTSLPICPSIQLAFVSKANQLTNPDTYTGYGDVAGLSSLREKISSVVYDSLIDSEEVFISDGSKCDLGRLQFLFGSNVSIGLQDPSYPAYIAASVIAGSSGVFDKEKNQYSNIVYLPCLPENDFFASIEDYPRTDLIYICSPNNPTGNSLTLNQLQKIVEIAKKRKSIVIYDSAYSQFIQSGNPKSIYEIKGADEVAIEVGSFSKSHGFTGIRLGWTVVPKKLTFSCGKSVLEDWKQVLSTYFNGASNIVQEGGLAALEIEGLESSKMQCAYYLQNSLRLKDYFTKSGYDCYGGEDAPYVWIDLKGRGSWEGFHSILENAHVVTTPGVGFGPSGEGFLRVSGFGTHKQTQFAIERLNRVFIRRRP